MPHVSDVRATSHDRHDPMLVAALAAGDLAGIDRDQATALAASCADCALLRDDLVALARATAAAPPPFAPPPRDYRLTPADAARLGPGGWRRLVAAITGVRSGLTRPLGVGLATIGLAGLLFGNVQLQLGSSAAMPAGQSGAAASSPTRDVRTAVEGAPAVSAAPDAQGGAPAAAGSAAPAPVLSDGTTSFGTEASPPVPGLVPIAPAATDDKAAPSEGAAGGLFSSVDEPSTPFRPLNLLFGAAVVLGLALLVLSRRDRSIV